MNFGVFFVFRVLDFAKPKEQSSGGFEKTKASTLEKLQKNTLLIL